MEPDSNITPQPEENERPRAGKRRQPSRKPIQMPAFIADMLSRKDVRWYFDVRLYSPLILLLLILALLPCGHEEPKEQPQVTEPTEIVMSTEPALRPEPLDPDAVALAKLADSVGAGRSKNVKIIIMWIAVNRSEAGGVEGYGQSLREEIARANQWEGYDENVAYSEETYQWAKDVLATAASGDLRPLDSDMLWLVMNNDGSVTTRNQFTKTNVQKWHEKTVK